MDSQLPIFARCKLSYYYLWGIKNIMYNFQRYHSKELALAYMSGKTHSFSPEQFLAELKKVEGQFESLLKHGTSKLVTSKVF